MRRMDRYSLELDKFLAHGFLVHPGLAVVRARSLDGEWTQWMIVQSQTGAAILYGFYTDHEAAKIADGLAYELDWLTASSESEPHRERAQTLLNDAIAQGFIDLEEVRL